MTLSAFASGRIGHQQIEGSPDSEDRDHIQSPAAATSSYSSYIQAGHGHGHGLGKGWGTRHRHDAPRSLVGFIISKYCDPSHPNPLIALESYGVEYQL